MLVLNSHNVRIFEQLGIKPRIFETKGLERKPILEGPD